MDLLPATLASSLICRNNSKLLVLVLPTCLLRKDELGRDLSIYNLLVSIARLEMFYFLVFLSALSLALFNQFPALITMKLFTIVLIVIQAI